LLPWQSNSGIIIFKESCYARARSTACHKLCFSYIKTDVSKGTHDYYTRFIYWKVPVGHSPRRIKPAPPDRGRWQVVERDDTAVDTQHDWTADIDPPDRGRWQAAEAADAAVDTQHTSPPSLLLPDATVWPTSAPLNVVLPPWLAPTLLLLLTGSGSTMLSSPEMPNMALGI
jgi:hypothetical protein